MLQQVFKQTAGQYTTNRLLIDELWNDIETHYGNKKRHYHTITHLQQLLTELTEQKSLIKNWNAVTFSICYHDIIYDVKKQDNEEKSAEYARKKLQLLNVDANTVNLCCDQINATKKHVASGDLDTDLFTDADLAILGKPWPQYLIYTKQIRAEYKIYPNLLYKPGRKKVLQHFLQMPRIYKTPPFFNEYEIQARPNMEQEIKEL